MKLRNDLVNILWRWRVAGVGEYVPGVSCRALLSGDLLAHGPGSCGSKT